MEFYYWRCALAEVWEDVCAADANVAMKIRCGVLNKSRLQYCTFEHSFGYGGYSSITVLFDLSGPDMATSCLSLCLLTPQFGGMQSCKPP